MHSQSFLVRAALVALLLQAPVMAQSAGTSAPAAAELTQLLRDFLAGASRNDAAIHDRFWADDLIYTGATGRRRSKADVMADVRKAPPEPRPSIKYTAEEIRIQQYGDTAIVAFRLVATPVGPAAPGAPSAGKAPAPGKANAPAPQGATGVTTYMNSGTFLRRNGQWRVVAWQATRIL